MLRAICTERLGVRRISRLLQQARFAKPHHLLCDTTLFCFGSLWQPVAYLPFHAEATGRNMKFIPERSAEMGGVVESPRVGDFGNRVSRASGVAKVFAASRQSHSQNRFGDGCSLALENFVYVPLGTI